MKKIFFSIFAVAALALTSCAGGAGGANVLDMDPAQCDDTTEKCWKYTLTYAGVSADAYLWGTEKVVVETIQAAATLDGYTATMEESAAEDAVACSEKNLQ